MRKKTLIISMSLCLIILVGILSACSSGISMKFDVDTIEIYTGETVKLPFSINNESKKDFIIWQGDGLYVDKRDYSVTAYYPGVYNISATYDGKSAYIKVIVIDKVAPNNPKFEQDSLWINKNENAEGYINVDFGLQSGINYYDAEVSNSNCSVLGVTYEYYINDYGQLEYSRVKYIAKEEGKTTIKLTFENGTSCSIDVVVSNKAKTYPTNAKFNESEVKLDVVNNKTGYFDIDILEPTDVTCLDAVVTSTNTSAVTVEYEYSFNSDGTISTCRVKYNVVDVGDSIIKLVFANDFSCEMNVTVADNSVYASSVKFLAPEYQFVVTQHLQIKVDIDNIDSVTNLDAEVVVSNPYVADVAYVSDLTAKNSCVDVTATHAGKTNITVKFKNGVQCTTSVVVSENTSVNRVYNNLALFNNQASITLPWNGWNNPKVNFTTLANRDITCTLGSYTMQGNGGAVIKYDFNLHPDNTGEIKCTVVLILASGNSTTQCDITSNINVSNINCKQKSYTTNSSEKHVIIDNQIVYDTSLQQQGDNFRIQITNSIFDFFTMLDMVVSK